MTAANADVNRPPIIPVASRSLARWRWLLGAGVGVGLAILYFFNPTEHRFYPVCQFYQLTHLHCPGCGSLRALHQLTHGHLGAAFGSNPLLIGSLPLVAWHGVQRLRRAAPPAANQPPLRPAFVWIIFGIVLVFGVLRNLPGPAFAWMAP